MQFFELRFRILGWARRSWFFCSSYQFRFDLVFSEWMEVQQCTGGGGLRDQCNFVLVVSILDVEALMFPNLKKGCYARIQGKSCGVNDQICILGGLIG